MPDPATPAGDGPAGLPPPRRLILTRPRAQAQEWVQRMARLGVPCDVLPLLDIAPLDPAPAREAWRRLPAQSLLMFVSPNAVEHFFAARPPGVPWPAGTLAATVGPGSAQALLQQGVPAALLRQPPADASSLDSEHLWPVLASNDWQGRQALMVRGDGGREWLADRLREAGAIVDAISVYRRAAPQLTPPERGVLDRALDAPQSHVWLFSSAEAIDHLPALAGRPVDWSRACAIATHERIAQRAQQLGVGHVVLTRPDADAVAAALQGPWD
ncbi:uroporphyrinogen-III synthase [Pelomonas sp. APW6]|uniref:Uroporphyrinogen-III synthase n=1 Tax=Roseateles subflavus TaxID=3053353 RepID=A0ABT7LHH9_9BURK|nr:uroporphyrinogen-III synthase [Pelomonas sp. APW6]MDL5032323.1 uroporphyrinogen-III synthase [Pelomonas sp. APW6]